jgi:hypothetical protein
VIDEDPAASPLTTPVANPMDAMDVLLLLQVPPVVASLRVMLFPWQTTDGPVMGESGKTTTLLVEKHPAGVIYLMLTIPPETPVIIPETLPIVAIEVVALLHVPPGAELLNVVALPVQTVAAPVITGVGFTVSGTVATHPLPVV